MKKMILSAIGALVFSSALFAVAPSKKELLNLPAGVANVKYENGIILSVIVVGKTDVPKDLRRDPIRAARYAGLKAQQNAREHFVRYLSAECKYGKTAFGNIAISKIDAAEKKSGTQDSGFTEIEMTKAKKEQVARYCISALRSLCLGVDDTGCYTWVGAWDAESIAHLEKIMSNTKNEAK